MLGVVLGLLVEDTVWLGLPLATMDQLVLILMVLDRVPDIDKDGVGDTVGVLLALPPMDKLEVGVEV